jgi:hypothetical protein
LELQQHYQEQIIHECALQGSGMEMIEYVQVQISDLSSWRLIDFMF